jgi:hypothetical protein
MSDDINNVPEQPVEATVPEAAPEVAQSPKKRRVWPVVVLASAAALLLLAAGARIVFGMHRAFEARWFRHGYAASQQHLGGWYGPERGLRFQGRGFGHGPRGSF